MPSLRDQAARLELIRRLESLTPAARPKWGRLDAPRMLCHVGDTFAMALGEIAVPSMNRKALQCFPLKHLIIHVLPFPKSAPAPPEILATAPDNFDADRRRLAGFMERLAAAPNAPGPAHPVFGPLSNNEWNVLQWKHVDHHLKQFGC